LPNPAVISDPLEFPDMIRIWKVLEWVINVGEEQLEELASHYFRVLTLLLLNFALLLIMFGCKGVFRINEVYVLKTCGALAEEPSHLLNPQGTGKEPTL
jgi:hypothetical protein